MHIPEASHHNSLRDQRTTKLFFISENYQSNNVKDGEIIVIYFILVPFRIYF